MQLTASALAMSLVVGVAVVPLRSAWSAEDGGLSRQAGADRALDWVATFHCEPLTDLYYDPAGFPEGLSRLITAGKGAFNAIETGLRDENRDVRFTCIVALNQMRLDDAMRRTVGPWMVKALMDTSSWVRVESAWGLGKLRWKKATGALIAVLDDEDINVVKEALVALDKLHCDLLPDDMTQDVIQDDNSIPGLVAEWKAYARAADDDEALAPPRLLPEGTVVREEEAPPGAVRSYVFLLPSERETVSPPGSICLIVARAVHEEEALPGADTVEGRAGEIPARGSFTAPVGVAVDGTPPLRISQATVLWLIGKGVVHALKPAARVFSGWIGSNP